MSVEMSHDTGEEQFSTETKAKINTLNTLKDTLMEPDLPESAKEALQAEIDTLSDELGSLGIDLDALNGASRDSE